MKAIGPWASAIVAGLLLSRVVVWAQATSTSPAFDVASVKVNRSGDAESSSVVQPGGRYTATNVTLRMLVKSAYGVHDNQLTGGPAWVDTDRFDISAKAEGYTTASAFRDQARLMLRPLLAERFTLVLRRERQDLPVYALVFRRDDRRFGPQFRRTDDSDCAGPAKAIPPAPRAPEEEVPLPCGAEIYAPGHLAARGMALSNFVLNVSRWADRVVVDRTELVGKFDWDLQWTPELTSDTPDTPGSTSLFGAIEDQAGFRLERQRGPVDVLVIERVEPPIPD